MPPRAVPALLLALLLTAAAAPAADEVQAATDIPKFRQSVHWTTPAYTRTFSKITEQFSSPAVFYRGPKRVPHIVAGFPNGHIYVWRADTGKRWLDRFIGYGAVFGSITLTDLNRDGDPDVVASTSKGDVVGFTLDTNKTLFHAWSGNTGTGGGNFSTPVVTDVNNDGRKDIVQTSWDQHLHVWDGRYLSKNTTRELPGFPLHLQDTSFSSPAVIDINRDGRKDIIFGYDCDGVYGQRCYQRYNRYRQGGYVTAINGTGPYRGKPLYGWPRFVHNQTVWSSPAVTDLNGDGHRDVIVGTGNMLSGGQRVYAFNRHGGYVPGWPVNVHGRTTSSPAVGDLDNDGKTEVAIVDDHGYLYVINRDGHIRFSRCISNSRTGCGVNGPKLHASPIIANVIGDPYGQQVVVGGEQQLYVFNRFGDLKYHGFAWWGEGTRSRAYTAAPTYAYVPGKRATIFVATGTRNHGQILGWRPGASYHSSDWPTFHKKMGRFGLLR